MPRLEEDLLVRLCAVIHDPVTTTDELIPSGETSSYRSNPIGLSEFTLSRRVPEYVARSKAVRSLEALRAYIAGFAPYSHLLFFLVQFLSVVLAPIPSNITAAAGAYPGAGGQLPESAGRFRQHLL